MSPISPDDIAVLRRLNEAIVGDSISKTDNPELNKFLLKYEAFICQRLTSTTGIPCSSYPDFSDAVFTDAERRRIKGIVAEAGSASGMVACVTFFFEFLILILTRAQLFDVLRDAGIIGEPDQDISSIYQLGDNGTYWRRRKHRRSATTM